VVHPRDGRSIVIRAGALLLAWGLLVGVLIGLGEGVVHSSALTTLDRHVTSVVVAHRSQSLTAVMKVVTWLGSWAALVVVGVLLIVLAVRHRLSPWFVVLAIVAWAGEAGGVAVIKHVVGRPRPPETIRLVTAHGWSFPSGHTAVAALVFSTLAVVIGYLVPKRGVRWLAWSLGGLAVALVAFSRIELGVHWLTDVVGSLLFMTAWLILLVVLLASGVRQPTVATGLPGQATPDDSRLAFDRGAHAGPPAHWCSPIGAR
jgi:undecaprenyl-diphosphatase